jgi:hypothetical protein
MVSGLEMKTENTNATDTAIISCIEFALDPDPTEAAHASLYTASNRIIGPKPEDQIDYSGKSKAKTNQEQKIPRIPIIKGLKKTVSTMHLDTVEELSLRILTLQCIHCWIKNLIPAVDPTHTQPKIPKSL